MMAEPATSRAVTAGAPTRGSVDPPTETVLPAAASAPLTDAPSSPGAPTDAASTWGARTHAPGTHRRGLSNGRHGPGLLAGLRLALPGRRSPRSSSGGGAGRRRFPLRPGSGDGQIDLRNTWQVVAGSLLVPLGVVFILMSWYGAAHTAYVQQQIPYLVSGSFAGVGCMVLGGLLYWAHWLYRIYDQADLHHQEELDVLRQTLGAIAKRLDANGEPADGAGAGADNGQRAHGAHLSATDAGAGEAPGQRFIANDGGAYFHVPGCPVVAHHGEGMRPVTTTEQAQLEPCRICRPTEAVEQGSVPAAPAANGR